MKAKIGAGSVGGFTAKGGVVELDGEDIAKAGAGLGKVLGIGAVAVAALAVLSSLGEGIAECENPKGTFPIGVGPIEFQHENLDLRGRMINRSIRFVDGDHALEVSTDKITLVRTTARYDRSRLTVLLTDGSTIGDLEFAPGTLLRFETAAGEQAIAPRFYNRWNPLGERGYNHLYLVGAKRPAEIVATVQRPEAKKLAP
jgi:hypothetical protein